jgi:hypothetical protein
MLSLFVYLFSSLLCVVTANLLISHPTKIVDIVHYNIPDLKHSFSNNYLSDILVLSQTIFCVSLMDAESLTQIFLIMGITQTLKAICSVSTVLPPLKNWEDKHRLGGLNGTGTEYIFSGHACYSAISAIYLYNKGIANFLTLLIFNSLSQFFIVVTRNHYTVDVILAWIITFLVYGNLNLCLSLDSCSSKIKFLL